MECQRLPSSSLVLAKAPGEVLCDNLAVARIIDGLLITVVVCDSECKAKPICRRQDVVGVKI